MAHLHTVAVEGSTWPMFIASNWPGISSCGDLAAVRYRPLRKVYGAHRAFGKAFCLDPKGPVEASPEVLPRNRRGQFHQLLRIEMFAQVFEQLFRDVGRCTRHRHGETQNP